jgi:DNA-binding XRE family transcriptional regulator
MKNNIAEFRIAKDYTMRDLATRAGCALSQIHYLEHENGYPKLDLAYKIAYALGKTVYEVWPEEGEDLGGYLC